MTKASDFDSIMRSNLAAKHTAREIAEQEAKKRLNHFIGHDAPVVLQRYLDLLDLGPGTAADDIANLSGSEEGNGKRT